MMDILIEILNYIVPVQQIVEVVEQSPEKDPRFVIGLFMIITGVPLTLSGNVAGIIYVGAGIGLIIKEYE